MIKKQENQNLVAPEPAQSLKELLLMLNSYIAYEELSETKKKDVYLKISEITDKQMAKEIVSNSLELIDPTIIVSRNKERKKLLSLSMLFQKITHRKIIKSVYKHLQTFANTFKRK